MERDRLRERKGKSPQGVFSGGGVAECISEDKFHNERTGFGVMGKKDEEPFDAEQFSRKWKKCKEQVKAPPYSDE